MLTAPRNSMAPILALQMDPLERIYPLSDSSILLGEEAQRRGYEVWHYTPDTLSLSAEGISAEVVPIRFSLDASPDWKTGEKQRRNLAEASVVLLRQDPPFDMDYITSTYLLEALPITTRVLNNPFHVRNNPEKLFPLQFKAFCPPSCVTSSAQEIEHFHRQHRDIVIKPLYGHGGHGVFRLSENDPNAAALIEMLLLKRGEPLVAQLFLPEVETQERRIVLIGGEVAGVIARIPPQGEIRSNLRVGGKAAVAELTPRQAEICEALGPVLREKQLLLAGVDVIGDWLNEINITSPTGLRQLKSLYGTSPEKRFWDMAEAP